MNLLSALKHQSGWSSAFISSLNYNALMIELIEEHAARLLRETYQALEPGPDVLTAP